MRLEDLNALSGEDAAVQFLRCCGSTDWARLMSGRRPFSTSAQMADVADQVWWSLDREDWLEAFAAHPRIGDSSTGRPVLDTREGYGPSVSRVGVGPHAEASGGGAPASLEKEDWASNEQSGMNAAGQDVRERLARANREYEARFGYVFIVCATGKSADEMLAMPEGRLSNAPSDELRIAAAEQGKITQLRLSKLLSDCRAGEAGK
jgi:2-oxo-4-hydroxy-4-carboxy-5-ureidoimidazoline decarboxylase